jgi:hypothetical protein
MITQSFTTCRATVLCILLSLIAYGSTAAAGKKLDLIHSGLELPAAPSVMLPADLNEDGLQDLVMVLAYSEWDRITVDEKSMMEGINHLVTVMTVVPTIIDRRELRVYFARPEGGYEQAVAPMPLDLSILSVGAGPAGIPVALLTDDGLSRLLIVEGDGGKELKLQPMLTRRPILAFSRTLVPGQIMAPDLDGDGINDLLFPATEGMAVYLATPSGLQREPVSLLAIPGLASVSEEEMIQFYPLPKVKDVDGDDLPDLLVPDLRFGWDRLQIYRNLGGGRFDQAKVPHDGPHVEGPEVVHFADLDGDGRAEYVTEELLDVPGDGMRAGLKEAKRPPKRIRLHRSSAASGMEQEPYHEFDAEGYAFDVSDDEIRLPGGFQDLDGDGRQDLVTLTLDFSLMQVLRILTTQSIKLGLDFHVWCQESDGRFRKVEGLDLSGKFRINLKNFQLGQLSQFAGDFDGDGLADFLQIGRGRMAAIHRGGQGCFYPAQPDLQVRMIEAPRDLSLVRVDDINADGLSDIVIIQPQEPDPKNESMPVRLDLYLSGEGQ